MRIYKPLLFVGLGGTGCQIGGELERRLRDELCGPDGMSLIPRLQGTRPYAPFQLPASIQFVYVDLSAEELAKVRRSVAPPDYLNVVDLTARHLNDLIPPHRAYPYVARSLRLNLHEETKEWLPPAEGEPRVAPLDRGAGQYPTVGRAALFETVRYGIAPAQSPILAAIGDIATSGAEHTALGGRLEASCDVFVAFSVAGGTGGGLFFDYLHLIADAFFQHGWQVRIYPLVLMPSAFPDGEGGGRPAVLNAGRALLDLFRLVDDQNAPVAPAGDDHAAGLDPSISVVYPGRGKVHIVSSSVQTAVLFSSSPGVKREDLHRSIVSFILSLVATDRAPDDAGMPAADGQYQSFADDFINRVGIRGTSGQAGVGNQGVSTSLVASLTVPVDDIADIITSHLIAAATKSLSEPPPGRAEENLGAIEKFFTAAGLDELRVRTPLPVPEDDQTAKGARTISDALQARLVAMRSNLQALETQLRRRVPQMAQQVDYVNAIQVLLHEVDLFRLKRVIIGDERLEIQADKLGFRGLLENRRRKPAPPDGINDAAPTLPPIRDRLAGRVKAKWSDQNVAAAITDQDDWYKWQTRCRWHAAWDDQALAWGRTVQQMLHQFDEIVREFVAHAQIEPGQFDKACADLYRERTGALYVLPEAGPDGDLGRFYELFLRRFREKLQLHPAATEGDILNRILGRQGWWQAFNAGYQRGADEALATVQGIVKQEVKSVFGHEGDAGAQPLLPGLAELLQAAASNDPAHVGADWLQQFNYKSAALLPAGFLPQGTGLLKVLVSYPAAGRDGGVERFLTQRLSLPGQPDLRPTAAESLVVVLFRSEMSVTDVREIRQVLRQWAQAVRHEQPTDYLKWRQRLGYDFGYLLTTEEHRVRITHHLLSATWNGLVEVTEGPPESPRRIRIRTSPHEGAFAMSLRLEPFGKASSWGSIIRAYEEYTLADDDSIRQEACGVLMSTLPVGLSDGQGSPSDLYRVLRRVGEEQPEILEKMLPDLPPGGRVRAERLLAFWTMTVQGALDKSFEGTHDAIRDNLRGLEQLMVAP